MKGCGINKYGLYQIVYAIDNELSDTYTWNIVAGPKPIGAMRTDGVVDAWSGCIKKLKAIYGVGSVKHGWQWYAEDCIFLTKNIAEAECNKRNVK